MIIRFNLEGHSAIAEWQLEAARQEAEAEYRKCGWLDARCEIHGGGVTVSLSPFVDSRGKLRFFRREAFCCGLLEEQLANELRNWQRFQWPRGIVRPSEPEPALSSFRVLPLFEPDAFSRHGRIEFHILANGEPIVNFKSFATDLNEWDVTRTYGGGYFVITCGCGFPDCAGIETPLQVLHRQDVIEWRMIQPRESVWRFAKTEYVNALYRLIADVKRFVGTAKLDELALVPHGNRAFFEQHGFA